MQDYQLRPDLRTSLKDKTGKLRELDAVIVGNTKAVVGSHKTFVKGYK